MALHKLRNDNKPISYWCRRCKCDHYVGEKCTKAKPALPLDLHLDFDARVALCFLAAVLGGAIPIAKGTLAFLVQLNGDFPKVGKPIRSGRWREFNEWANALCLRLRKLARKQKEQKSLFDSIRKKMRDTDKRFAKMNRAEQEQQTRDAHARSFTRRKSSPRAIRSKSNPR